MTAAPKPDHVILTRFNLPSEGNERVIRAREGWLRDRVVLFERYCLPSVLAQTCGNFRWIIYFDPESPDWLKERIEVWRRHDPIRPVFRATVSREQLIEDLSSALGSRRTTLITTNLDNDDGLAIDFIERLQAEPCPETRAALYFEGGLIKSGRQLFLRADRENAFCSVRESWEDPVGCWAAVHNRLGEIMPVRRIAGAPAWLQVVHGANVSNRVHGRLVGPERYRQRFPGALSDARMPTAWDRAKDALIFQPGRLVREALRGSAKRAIWTLFGFEALDEAKRLWTAARSGATGQRGRGHLN